MQDLSYPVWCLEYVDTTGVYDILKLYIKLVQSKGDESHDIANEIGKISIQRKSIAENLKNLLTIDNCLKGMKQFLEGFERGKLVTLAKEIGAEDDMLQDIKKLFSVEYSALWEGTTGENEIRKLITEYDVVKHTNILLNVTAHNKDSAFKSWREALKFIGFSCEMISEKRPELSKFFTALLHIANYDDMLPDNMESFLKEMTEHNAEIKAFGADMLSASAHKFNGPKGIGFLYKSKNCGAIRPFHNGGSQEFGMRAGTENIAAIVGMAVALKNNISEMNNNIILLNHLSELFLTELRKSNTDFILNGHPSDRLPGNINISIKNRSGEGLMHMLDLKGICISTGSACDSINQKTSHVIEAIRVPKDYAEGTVRITFGNHNSEQDVVDVAKSILKMLSL